MDGYLHFVQAHSLYLFRGRVLNSRVREAWGVLRIVVLHYFRSLSDKHDTRPRRPASGQRRPCATLPSCPRLEVADFNFLGCLRCHGRPQNTVKGKCKIQQQSDAADVGKVFLWQYNSLSRMASVCLSNPMSNL